VAAAIIPALRGLIILFPLPLPRTLCGGERNALAAVSPACGSTDMRRNDVLSPHLPSQVRESATARSRWGPQQGHGQQKGYGQQPYPGQPHTTAGSSSPSGSAPAAKTPETAGIGWAITLAGNDSGEQMAVTKFTLDSGFAEQTGQWYVG
jgi:hypothetical protein